MTLMRIAAAALLATLAGCASPNPNLYTLAAQPGPVQHTGKLSVELRRIGLAAYLDRPSIVRSSADFRVRVADNDRWSEPLGSMLDRVFTEDLLERLPDATIFAESGAISTRAGTIVEIDVQRFDADAADRVILLAQVAIRPDGDAGATATARTLRLMVSPAGTSTSDLAAALSTLLGQLADAVAQTIAGR